MNNKFFLTVIGAFTLLNGLGTLIAPGLFLDPIGAETNAVGLSNMQYFGASTIGLAIILLSARNLEDWKILRFIYVGGFATYGIACIIGILATISGTMNVLGWGVSGIDGFITLVFAYFLFVRKN